jgi:hypothetical protein
MFTHELYRLQEVLLMSASNVGRLAQTLADGAGPLSAGPVLAAILVFTLVWKVLTIVRS